MTRLRPPAAGASLGPRLPAVPLASVRLPGRAVGCGCPTPRGAAGGVGTVQGKEPGHPRGGGKSLDRPSCLIVPWAALASGKGSPRTCPRTGRVRSAPAGRGCLSQWGWPCSPGAQLKERRGPPKMSEGGKLHVLALLSLLFCGRRWPGPRRGRNEGASVPTARSLRSPPCWVAGCPPLAVSSQDDTWGVQKSLPTLVFFRTSIWTLAGLRAPGRRGVVLWASRSHRGAALSSPRRSLERDCLASGPPARRRAWTLLSDTHPGCSWARETCQLLGARCLPVEGVDEGSVLP